MFSVKSEISTNKLDNSELIFARIMPLFGLIIFSEKAATNYTAVYNPSQQALTFSNPARKILSKQCRKRRKCSLPGLSFFPLCFLTLLRKKSSCLHNFEFLEDAKALVFGGSKV